MNYKKYLHITAKLLFSALLLLPIVGTTGLLELPIIANIIGFHAFLDGGLLIGGAVLANIYLLAHTLLYANRETLKPLINRK